jgi:histidinol dehydrogenase
MITRLEYSKKSSKEVFNFIDKLDAMSAEIPASVLEIIENVRKNGDDALIFYAEKFDNARLKGLKVQPEDIKKAYKLIDKSVIPSIRKAIKNITDFHSLQRKNIKDYVYKNTGYTIKQKYIPVDSAGIYIPGGQAPLFSTVLMACIPALCAEVKNINIISPPKYNGEVNPYVLVAADMLEIRNIYRSGGAQAIAAFAYGTKTVPKVNKIVGPGNIYSTAAKKHLFGIIGIESINGPSEITIIADDTAKPEFVLYDMLAQAEHVNGHSMLVTTSEKLAAYIESELKKKEAGLKITALIVKVKSLEDAAHIANMKGPEHLTVVTGRNPEIIDLISNAPAIFEGNYSPVAFGDYMAGANHILPTNGTSKFFSALSVLDFLKHTHIVKCSKLAMEKFGPAAEQMAATETLINHKKSMAIRRGIKA